MKKILLSVIFITIMLAQANAQNKKFNFGFKVAPAISWLNIDEPGISGNGAKLKFNWGFIGAYNFYENFSFVSGFNINSLGGKYKFDPDGKNEIKYSELQIPLIFQMKTTNSGDAKFFAQIGLAEGVMLKARDKDKNNIHKEVKNFNTAYILGIGTEIKFMDGADILVQLRYNGGLTDIGKEVKCKNNFFEFGVGLMF